MTLLKTNKEIMKTVSTFKVHSSKDKIVSLINSNNRTYSQETTSLSSIISNNIKEIDHLSEGTQKEHQCSNLTCFPIRYLRERDSKRTLKRISTI